MAFVSKIDTCCTRTFTLLTNSVNNCLVSCTTVSFAAQVQIYYKTWFTRSTIIYTACTRSAIFCAVFASARILLICSRNKYLGCKFTLLSTNVFDLIIPHVRVTFCAKVRRSFTMLTSGVTFNTQVALLNTYIWCTLFQALVIELKWVFSIFIAGCTEVNCALACQTLLFALKTLVFFVTH